MTTSAHVICNFEQRCDEHRIVGAVAGMSVGGVRTVATCGLADRAAGAALTRDTFMMAGSVTKAMTASIVSMLVADGLIDLDAPVVAVLPSFRVADPAATRSITTRHLLTHTAGFDGDIWIDTGDDDDAIERLVARLGTCGQLSPAGVAFSYNNAAYAVLGRMIERVTGDAFEHALQSRIASPSGAALTTDPSRVAAARTAVGHVPGADGNQEPVSNVIGPACLSPAGSRTWATIDDLLAFGELHLGRHGGPGVHEALRSMRSPQIVVNDPNNGGTMALGVFLDDRWGTPVVFHDGGVHGQAAYLRILPELDAVLAVMSTGGVPQVFHRHVFAQMASTFAGLTAPLGVGADHRCVVEPSRYIGRFEASATRVDVADDGHGLTAEITWGRGATDEVTTGVLRMWPHSPEVFLVPLAGRDYVIVYPAPGEPADHLLAGLRRLNRVPAPGRGRC